MESPTTSNRRQPPWEKRGVNGTDAQVNRGAPIATTQRQFLFISRGGEPESAVTKLKEEEDRERGGGHLDHYRNTMQGKEWAVRGR